MRVIPWNPDELRRRRPPAGQFYAVPASPPIPRQHLYNRTYRGQRVQRFMYKGIGTVAKLDQGTVWPRSEANHEEVFFVRSQSR